MEAFYDHLIVNINDVQLSLKQGIYIVIIVVVIIIVIVVVIVIVIAIGIKTNNLIDPIRLTVGIHKSLLPNDTKLPGCVLLLYYCYYCCCCYYCYCYYCCYYCLVSKLMVLYH